MNLVFDKTLKMASTTQDIPERNCRICFDGDIGDAEELVKSPCNCSGTMALVHASCLETWLSMMGRDRCEICHFTFETTRIVPSFREYVKDPKNRVGLQLATFIAEVFSFLLPTSVMWVLAYQWYIDRKRSGQVYFEGWETVAIFVGSLALLSVCFVWGRGTLRHYYYVWNAWRLSNQQIRVALPARDREEDIV